MIPLLVTARGRLRAHTIADAERAHERMFDALSSVARSHGNVAHLPYLRAAGPPELLIVDGWSDRAGAERVMGAPELSREIAPVWSPLPEIRFWEPAGWDGSDDRSAVPPHAGALVLVRGRVREGDAARAAHDRLFAELAPVAHELGHVAHLPYLSVDGPRELVVLDFWEDGANAATLMSDPGLAAAFAGFFAEAPDVTRWDAAPWPAYDDSRRSLGD